MSKEKDDDEFMVKCCGFFLLIVLAMALSIYYWYVSIPIAVVIIIGVIVYRQKKQKNSLVRYRAASNEREIEGYMRWKESTHRPNRPIRIKEHFCRYCGILKDKELCDFCGRSSKVGVEYTEDRSRYIPKTVQREVWRRDGGRCVECGSQERLEYDHIIPFSKGGSNTVRNIQLLCEKCNRNKHNII